MVILKKKIENVSIQKSYIYTYTVHGRKRPYYNYYKMYWWLEINILRTFKNVTVYYFPFLLKVDIFYIKMNEARLDLQTEGNCTTQKHISSLPIFSVALFKLKLFRVVFCGSLLVCFISFFYHCIVCPSIHGFWLPFLNLYTFSVYKRVFPLTIKCQV